MQYLQGQTKGCRSFDRKHICQMGHLSNGHLIERTFGTGADRTFRRNVNDRTDNCQNCVCKHNYIKITVFCLRSNIHLWARHTTLKSCHRWAKQTTLKNCHRWARHTTLKSCHRWARQTTLKSCHSWARQTTLNCYHSQNVLQENCCTEMLANATGVFNE